MTGKSGGSVHYVKRCRHGTVVVQCRCAGPKSVETVPCPDWCSERNLRDQIRDEMERAAGR